MQLAEQNKKVIKTHVILTVIIASLAKEIHVISCLIGVGCTEAKELLDYIDVKLSQCRSSVTHVLQPYIVRHHCNPKPG